MGRAHDELLELAPIDSPDFYINDPHAALARIRNEAPVLRYEHLNSWLVTKYDDIKMMSRTPGVFCVAKGDTGPPFKVGNQRGSERGIIGHPGIVRCQPHQRGKAEPLFFADPQAQVLAQHPLVTAEVFRVLGGTAEHLAPPRCYMAAVVLVNSAREERGK